MKWKMIVVATLVAAGCASEPVGSTVAAVTSGVPLTGPGCDQGRRVGIPTRGMTCPAPTSSAWLVSYLFQQPTTITYGGQPFCLYEYVGSVGSFSTSGLPTDPGTGAPGSTWTDADCLGVIPLGDSAEIVERAHAEATRMQMGSPDSLPTIGSLPETVRVAILDSSVDSGPNDVEPTTGEYLHGRMVAAAVQENSCIAGVCIPDFDSYLVLDEGGDPDVPGGHYGSVGTLATAIESAVVNAAGSRLLMPLAVGWTSPFNHRDADPNQPEANTVKAVHAALSYAVCEGVLTLAAAGNRTSSKDFADPVYPAAWEEAVVACDDERPLVYAVGAVRPNGEPLAVSREGGQPPFVAAGQAVTYDLAGSAATGTWTGTSMGVAHVAAAATLVWGYQPSLTPSQVMDEVWASAFDLGVSADFCFHSLLGEPCPDSRRVTACDALSHLLSPQSALCMYGGCPEPSCAARPAELPYLTENELDLLMSIMDEGAVNGETLGERVDGTSCSNDVYGDGTLDPTQNYCPWENTGAYAGSPFSLDPQPDPDPCDVCSIFAHKKTEYVYMAIDPNMQGFLTSPTLQVQSFGFVSLEDGLNSPQLYPNDIVAVPLSGLEGALDYSSGTTLSFLWYKSPGTTPKMVSVEIVEYPDVQW